MSKKVRKWDKVMDSSNENNNKKKSTVLVIEDNENIRRQLCNLLSKEHKVIYTEDWLNIPSFVFKTNPDVVLLDLCLPPEPDSSSVGMSVISALMSMEFAPKIIVVTASTDKDDAFRAIDLGVFDFIGKPFDIRELEFVIKRALRMRELEIENANLRKALDNSVDFPQIITDCEEMQKIFSMVKRVAPTDCTVLIGGETGTGKELIARAIHRESPRSKSPFIAINCAAIPEQLLESELFGYEKGAFSGAYKSKAGKIELAEGGTLFLDEIGELPPGLQAKLLRFLQESEIERIGGRERIVVDVRVIAATNRNLLECIENRTFRKDLYYRLNVIGIHLPPLRERGRDVLFLAKYFLKKFSEGGKVKRFGSEVEQALLSYRWPGNVRELINKIKRAVLVSSKNVITLEDLDLSLDEVKHYSFSSLKEVRTVAEREFIIQALQRNNGNITWTAREIGTDRKSLRRLMQRYGIKKEIFQRKQAAGMLHLV